MPQRNYYLLDLMLDDMNSAPELYRPTNFWKHGGGINLKRYSQIWSGTVQITSKLSGLFCSPL